MPQGESCSDSMNPIWPLSKRIFQFSAFPLWLSHHNKCHLCLRLSFRARAGTYGPIFYKSGTIRGIRPPYLGLHWATVAHKRRHNKALFRRAFTQHLGKSCCFWASFLTPLSLCASMTASCPAPKKTILNSVHSLKERRVCARPKSLATNSPRRDWKDRRSLGPLSRQVSFIGVFWQ